MSPERVRFWTAQDPLPSCRRNREVRAKALFPTKGQVLGVGSTKQKPATGPFAPQQTAGSRQGEKNAASTKYCQLAAHPVPRGQLSIARWCVCWCVSVRVCECVFSACLWKSCCSLSACHSRPVQHSFLSFLLLVISPVSCLRCLAGSTYARPDGMDVAVPISRTLPSCRRRAHEICRAGTAATLTRNLCAEPRASLTAWLPFLSGAHLGQPGWALSEPER